MPQGQPYYPPAPGLGPTVVVLPAARMYDPAIKDFPLNADGTFQRVHPVDQRVAFALTVAKGSVPSAPDMGNRFRERIQRCDPKQIPNIAQDEVSSALADMIAAGDVKVLSVSTTAGPPVLLKVRYVNMRDPNTNLANPSANAQTFTAG